MLTAWALQKVLYRSAWPRVSCGCGSLLRLQILFKVEVQLIIFHHPALVGGASGRLTAVPTSLSPSAYKEEWQAPQLMLDSLRNSNMTYCWVRKAF